MKTGDGLIVVWMNVDPRHDEELHDWYEGEHVAEVAAIDGVLSVRRFYDPSHALRYMAMFECVDETIEPGAGFQKMVENATPWTMRIRKLFGEERRRGNYRLLHAEGNTGEGAALLVVQSDITPEDGAFDSARPHGCLSYRAYVQMPPENAFRPEHQHLEIYEFDDKDAADSWRLSLGAGGETDLSVRTRTGTPVIT
ncbi:hypothetical protein GCM10007928_35200 [Sulfitobacter porphyrae]|nr:hypothetical protein GCM10007928_35200 [Sulfitobacter porphyrae]